MGELWMLSTGTDKNKHKESCGHMLGASLVPKNIVTRTLPSTAGRATLELQLLRVNCCIQGLSTPLLNSYVQCGLCAVHCSSHLKDKDSRARLLCTVPDLTRVL